MNCKPFICFRLLLVSSALMLGLVVPTFAQDANTEHISWASADMDLGRDLASMQGRWQRLTLDGTGQVTMRQEKYIEDDLETIVNMNGDGSRINTHRQTKFRLEKHGPVRVLYCIEASSLSGRGRGMMHPMDFAFVYHVDERLFLDAPGLFETRRTYHPDPAVYVWTRIKDRSDTHKVHIKTQDGEVRVELTVADGEKANGTAAEQLVVRFVDPERNILLCPFEETAAGQFEAIIKPTMSGRHDYFIRTEAGDFIVGGHIDVEG